MPKKHWRRIRNVQRSLRISSARATESRSKRWVFGSWGAAPGLARGGAWPWNRVVDNDALEDEVGALIDVLLSKNQQAVRQLKFIINRGVEADQYTAQGFEALSAGLTAAVNGGWEVPDANHGRGVQAFASKGEMWERRRGLARAFWSDGPTPAESDH